MIFIILLLTKNVFMENLDILLEEMQVNKISNPKLEQVARNRYL